MKIGDLVKVHWGNSDYSGVEDVDWGYAPGIVMGDIVWWADTDTVQLGHKKRVSPCVDLEIMFSGEHVKYNIGRLEVVNEGRLFGKGAP